jgi:hypothetical protein
MYTPEEREYFRENATSDMGNSSLGNFINMFMLQPYMDNQAVNGFAKTYSFALEKALMTNNGLITYGNSHMFGSRFIPSVIDKVPILNKILPSHSKNYSKNSKILTKLFPNSEFHFLKGSENDIKNGYLNESGRNLKRVEKNLKVLKTDIDEISGKGFVISNKKANDTVRALKNIGITPDNFREGGIRKVNVKHNVVDSPWLSTEASMQNLAYETEELKTLYMQSSKAFNKDNLKKVISDKLIDNYNNLKNVQNGNDVVKGLRSVNINDKKNVLKILNKVTGGKVNLETNIDDAINIVNNYMKENSNEFVGIRLKSFTKDFLKKTTGKNTKEVFETFAENSAKILTEKSAMQKFFSSPFGKIITGVGSGPVGMLANFAGMGISMVANTGQEKSVNNMIQTVMDQYIQQKTPNFITNEATQHSIETHLKRSEDDLEEYKKVFYYRNTSNELREEISPISGVTTSLDDIRTS